MTEIMVIFDSSHHRSLCQLIKVVQLVSTLAKLQGGASS